MSSSHPKRPLPPLTKVMLGTMTWANQCDEKGSFAQLDEFVKLGGVWIDTAELYPVPPTLEKGGDTETLIGKWIAKHPELRSRVAIATKVAGPTVAGNVAKKRELVLEGKMPDHVNGNDLTAEEIERALDASLKRLQTDYIDLYQLHWPSRPVPLWGRDAFTEVMHKGAYGMRPTGSPNDREGVPFDDIVRCMGELIRKGKILAWGLSNETPFGVTRFCESAKKLGVPLPLTIQNDFSLLDRRFDGPLAEAASYYGVKLLAYGPLSGGTLSGKYLQDKGSLQPQTPSDDWRHHKFPQFQPRYHAERAVEATRKYAEVAKKHNLTLVQLALGWAATRYYMGSVIITANTVKEMVDDFRAVEEGPKNITLDVCHAINAIHEERPNPNVTYSEL